MMILIKPAIRNMIYGDVTSFAAENGSTHALQFLLRRLRQEGEENIELVAYKASIRAAGNGQLKIVKILERRGLLRVQNAFYHALNNVRIKSNPIRRKQLHAVIRYLITKYCAKTILNGNPVHHVMSDVFTSSDFQTFKLISPLLGNYWNLIHWVNRSAADGKITQLRLLLNMCGESIKNAIREAMISAAYSNKVKTMRMIHREYGFDESNLPELVRERFAAL